MGDAKKLLRWVLIVIGLLVLVPAVACVILGLLPIEEAAPLPPEAVVVGAPVQADGVKIAQKFPDLVTPPKNPVTAEKQNLGQLLFFDPILSAKHDMACATCHHPDLGFSNDKPTAIGSHGQALTRNVPTLYEAAYKTSLFWDGRADTLENQLVVPMTAQDEMAASPDKVVADLKAIPEYQALFAKAFPNQPEPITFENVTYALATFERSLIAHNSPYDRYARGDFRAMSPSQRRGLALFRSGGTRCYACHPGPEFSNGKFAVTGVPGADGKLGDVGRNAISGSDADKYAFAVPSLRNVALTAPYMHNGTFATLEEVISFYGKGGGKGLKLDIPNLSHSLYPFELSDQETHDLINFLYALTDESAKPNIPDKVPSGLPVVKPVDNPARTTVQAANTGATSATQRPPKTLTVTPDISIQSVVDTAVAGDTIEIQYGIYNERVVIDQNSITIRGIPRGKDEWPVLDGQMKYTDGIVATGNNFTVEQLSVKNYKGNGIIVDGVSGVIFRNLYIENMSLYGLYPVHCTNVLMERVKVTGIGDAGLYVGQSRDTIIRNNEAYGNVVGIEVENSINADVYNNHTYNNTAGISVHLLPSLPSKVSQQTRVHDNIIENNNLKNFGRPGTIVASVPQGTGMIIFGSDDVEVFNNQFQDNQTGGVGVMSVTIFLSRGELDIDPNPERIFLHNNTYKHNGYAPDPLLAKLGVSGADVIWDVSSWTNRFEDTNFTSFPPLLPSGGWPTFVRKAYWQVLHFVASKLG